MRRRAFLAAITTPAAVCAAVAVAAGPDSWLGWAAYLAEAPAAGIAGWIALRRMPTA